jgi:hypothetical protein
MKRSAEYRQICSNTKMSYAIFFVETRSDAADRILVYHALSGANQVSCEGRIAQHLRGGGRCGPARNAAHRLHQNLWLFVTTGTAPVTKNNIHFWKIYSATSRI